MRILFCIAFAMVLVLGCSDTEIVEPAIDEDAIIAESVITEPRVDEPVEYGDGIAAAPSLMQETNRRWKFNNHVHDSYERHSHDYGKRTPPDNPRNAHVRWGQTYRHNHEKLRTFTDNQLSKHRDSWAKYPNGDWIKGGHSVNNAGGIHQHKRGKRWYKRSYYRALHDDDDHEDIGKAETVVIKYAVQTGWKNGKPMWETTDGSITTDPWNAKVIVRTHITSGAAIREKMNAGNYDFNGDGDTNFWDWHALWKLRGAGW